MAGSEAGSMQEERIDPEDIRRLSRGLTACNVGLGGYLAISVFLGMSTLRELFEGMALALPLTTRLLLGPLALLLPTVIVLAVVAKEVVLSGKPLQSLRVNIYCLVGFVVLWMFMLKGMLAPLYQLIGNLG